GVGKGLGDGFRPLHPHQEDAEGLAVPPGAVHDRSSVRGEARRPDPSATERQLVELRKCLAATGPATKKPRTGRASSARKTPARTGQRGRAFSGSTVAPVADNASRARATS